ncbi:hypothetical protein BHE74_00048040, partial [Ensete ventricosum]
VSVPSLASVYNEYALKSQFETSIYLQVSLVYDCCLSTSINLLEITDIPLQQFFSPLAKVKDEISNGDLEMRDAQDY